MERTINQKMKSTNGRKKAGYLCKDFRNFQFALREESRFSPLQPPPIRIVMIIS